MFTLALDISLRITVAAAAVGFVLVIMRVRSGAMRHAAWAAVLLAMLTMPVLTAIVPRVDVPVPSTLAFDFRAVADQVPAPVEPVETPTGTATVPDSPAPFSTVASSNAPPRWQPSWTAVMLCVYGAGLLFFTLRLAAGWHFAQRLLRHAVPTALARRVPVLESPLVAAPLTIGIRRSVIVLPVGWTAWPDAKLQAVLAHEEAHVVRRDALVTFLAHVNRAVFWFHPLAWWLERTLATTAEHACDEAATRELGDARAYAAVLLDFADAVRVRRQRVAWQAIGVDGSGLLGARIDRLLRGDVLARMSFGRRAATAAGCAVILVAAVACRQQITAQPLQPDPDVQKQIDENKARSERHRAAVAMTAADAAALEQKLLADPNNVEARETLIIFYDQAGKVSWEDKLAGIRRHSLWRIANLPETDLWIPHISKRYDPAGYAQARKLWLEHTSKPDVTAKTLGRAAAFMSAYDKPVAEELLLRAHQMEPDGPWATRLGDLYARAIAGTVDPRYRTVDEGEAKSPFAQEVRRKLEGTTDPKILAAAGYELARYRDAGLEFGRQLLQRAATLDPQNARARTALANLQTSERRGEIQKRLDAAAGREKFDTFSDAMYAAVSALPEEDRLFYLPGAAESAYMRAENIDYMAKQKPAAEQEDARKRAAAGFARARQYASDAVALAERHRQSPDYGDVVYRAHTALGLLALKDGNREAAVKHMATAAAAPIPQGGNVTVALGLSTRLVEYLLRAGERESVAQYVETSAARFPAERDRLLTDAKRIRTGTMPLSYQYAEARR